MNNRMELTIKKKDIMLATTLWLFSMLVGIAILLFLDRPYNAGAALVPAIMYGIFSFVRHRKKSKK